MKFYPLRSYKSVEKHWYALRMIAFTVLKHCFSLTQCSTPGRYSLVALLTHLVYVPMYLKKMAASLIYSFTISFFLCLFTFPIEVLRHIFSLYTTYKITYSENMLFTTPIDKVVP